MNKMTQLEGHMASPVGAYCDWFGIFDNDAERYEFNQGLRAIEQAFVMVSLLFCTYGYWQGGLLVRKDQSWESHANLEFYFTAIYLRSVVVTFSNLELFQGIVKIWFDPCHFFAFWETFSAVLEIESLTHVCVERYVVAKYITHGWQIPSDHYTMYFYLSLMFSFVYALSFMSDFAGCMCTYDLLLPDTWKRRFIVAIFLFRSVKPTVFMIMMLFWANWMEKRFTSQMMKRADLDFTKTVTGLTIVNLICWAPFATIRGWVLFTRYMFIDVGLPLSTFYIQWAIWLHCAAPIVVMVTVVIIDLLTRCNPNYVTSQIIHQD